MGDLALAHVEQVLLEEERDFGIYLRAAAEPSFHHCRRHFRISVPLLTRHQHLRGEIGSVEVGAGCTHLVHVQALFGAKAHRLFQWVYLLIQVYALAGPVRLPHTAGRRGYSRPQLPQAVLLAEIVVQTFLGGTD